MFRDTGATEQAAASNVHHLLQQLWCSSADSGNDTKQLPWKISEILRGQHVARCTSTYMIHEVGHDLNHALYKA